MPTIPVTPLGGLAVCSQELPHPGPLLHSQTSCAHVSSLPLLLFPSQTPVVSTGWGVSSLLVRTPVPCDGIWSPGSGFLLRSENSCFPEVQQANADFWYLVRNSQISRCDLLLCLFKNQTRLVCQEHGFSHAAGRRVK